MKIPKYSNTNLILKYIVRYELAVSNIKHLKIPTEIRKPLFERLSAEEIDHCAQLIGFPIGYTTALRIYRGQENTTGRSKKRVYSSFRNTKDYIKKYNSGDIPISSDLLVHLNKILTKGWSDDWDQGRIKSFSEKPNELYDTWYSLSDYYPNTNMKTYFNEYFKWILNGEDNTHKLIQMSILLYEMIDKAPFFAGNQISSILMLELIAKEYGYNPFTIVPYFKSINFISEDIKSAYKMSKGKADLTIFIEALLYTLSLTANEISQEFENYYESRVSEYPNISEELNPRQIKLIEYLRTNSRASRNDFMPIMGVSFMTVFRDLQDLLDKGYIEKKGKSRGTYYTLKKKEREKPKVNEKLTVFSDTQVEIY